MARKKFMNIGEFARLRDVDLNSLRYYEKLGILRPAYVDGQTGYRYYAPEQLSQLDIVLLAIDVGMPLKELKRYIHGGTIDAESFMEKGETLLEEKINDLQMRLKNVRHTLKDIRDLREYENREGLYSRDTGERRIIASQPFFRRSMDYVEPLGIELFVTAQKCNMMPVLPSFFIIGYRGDEEICRLCFEIMNFQVDSPDVYSLPSGRYTCVQEELSDDTSISDVVRSRFGDGDLTVLVGNMFTSKLTFSEKKLEIQILPQSAAKGMF